MTPPATSRSIDLRVLTTAVLLSVLYVVSAAFGLLATEHGARFPIVLVPLGLALGATWRWGERRVLPYVAVATVAVVLALGGTPVGAIVQAVATTVGVLAATRVLRRVGFDGEFGRPVSVFAFVLGVVLGAACVVVAWTIGWLALHGLADGRVAELAGRWWLSTVVSAIVVFPIVATASATAFVTRAAGRIHVVLWAASVLCAVALIFALPPRYIGIPVFGALLVLVAWAVVRLNLLYAMLATLAGAAAVMISGAFEIGLLADEAPFRAARLGWNAAILFGLCALCLNAFVTSRERAERRYRALFDESPEPVWLTDPATDRFLEVNAAAVETYGWSAEEFAQLRVGDVVMRTERADIEADARAHEVHRCRDGRLLKIYSRRRELRLDDREARLWFNVDVTERATLRAALHRASSEERLRVSRELHDGLGQELTGISFVLGGVSAQMRRGETPERAEIDRVAELVRSALRSCRLIARGLAPLPDEMPLDEALHVMVERLAGGDGAVVELDVKPGAASLGLPVHVKDGMFRICQEAVTNALRHSGAAVISIVLDAGDYGVSLAVWDDGAGFDRQRARSGMGLRTLRLRAEEIGAMLTIDSRPGAGACIECRYLRHAREA
jgi:PAS domain S-box-containing protein